MKTDFGIDLRVITSEDVKKMSKLSYSNLNVLENCPLRWKFRYKDRMFSDKSSLAMEIGTILHKGLEIKAEALMDWNSTSMSSGIIRPEIDYESIKDIIRNGSDEETEKCKTHILGINELKKKYFEEWFVPDKFGKTYDQKLKTYFESVLPTRMQDDNWEIVGCELPFEFVYDNRVRISGFIDRVDRHKETGEYRVVDYKSSKKVFEVSQIRTSLQMFIYDCAVLVMYGVMPTHHEYDFVLLDEKQCTPEVCSKGYLKRAVKKVDKLLGLIDSMEESGEYPPKATPLCYWCTYHSDSPNADPKYKDECQWHSLWTPENRNFNVLNEWKAGSERAGKKTKRELIF